MNIDQIKRWKRRENMILAIKIIFAVAILIFVFYQSLNLWTSCRAGHSFFYCFSFFKYSWMW